MDDVLIVGAGPTGRALGAACARQGLTVVLVEEHPNRPWRSTYGAWSDELPAGTPVAATSSRVRAVTTVEHFLPRSYSVLDNDMLRELLSVPAVRVERGRAVAAVRGTAGTTAVLADGRELRASLVVDASGHRRALAGVRNTSAPAVQTAYGLMVPQDQAGPLVRPGEAVLMDWTQPAEIHRGSPSFLYGVPLGGGRTLLQETSLAHRPGVPYRELRGRLVSRLRVHGVRVTDAEVEKVRFPLDVPMPSAESLPSFGAAAAMTHPATGYTVATALRLAPVAARAIASALSAGPAVAERAFHAAVWPMSARTVHRMRRRGLKTVLTMPSALVPRFFAAYFSVAADLQKAYLSDRRDVAATACAMAAMFRTADWPLRRHAIRAVLGPSVSPLTSTSVEAW